jgi:DHA1 family bicyclomycin/chloramphenicol resistance-like MFS transporter
VKTESALRGLATPRKEMLGRTEFTALLAMSMAMAALGIDLMLPAFGAIRADLGLPPGSTAVAGLVTAYFLGLAVGQLAYGPLSDRYGRRTTLFVGYAIYAVGASAAVVSPSLTDLLVSRFVWGIGAAGPRVVTLAVIRDRFEGERMSQVMSFVMAVFLLVPIMAPSLGAAVVAVASWRWLFGACLVAVIGMALWSLRLPETLHEEHRLELRLGRIMRAARLVVSDRQTAAYTLAMTALYGVFISYIGSSEIIFAETFGLATAFPVIFGGLAAVMGGAMLVNARVVKRVGTRRLAHSVLIAYVVAAAALVGVAVATGGRPPLWLFLLGLAAMLAAHALLIPNFNTIAMAPMARIAGTASAVIGAVQIAVGALLGSLLDRAFDGTVRPLSFGFLGYGVVALALVVWAERGRLFRPPTDPVPEVPAAPTAEV